MCVCMHVMYMCAFVYVHVFVYMCVCIHVCVCDCMCVGCGGWSDTSLSPSLLNSQILCRDLEACMKERIELSVSEKPLFP